MTARVLLAVDLSNQVYRAAAAHQTLTSRDTFTGGLYGFLVSVCSAVLKVGATELVLCRDLKPYVRSQLYPDYKALRQETRDPELKALADTSMQQVLDLAAALGIPVWGVPGFESDDLIGHAVRRYGWRYQMVVAMSNDADLMQLFAHPRFALLRGGKEGGLQRALPTGRFVVDGKVTATPEEYVHMLCLMGTHNEVAGLPNVGPVRAAAMVQDPVKWRRAQAEHAELLARNRQLIALPHAQLEQAGRVALPRATRPFTPRDLYRFAARYDIDVTPRMTEAFEQVLP